MASPLEPDALNRPGSVEQRVALVGAELGQSFNRVLDALPGTPHRPQWLARQLGVNTVLTSRILKAAQQQDPIAIAHMIPGPEPLRRLLRAAERKKVDRDLIESAERAVDRFEQLIDAEAGDRSALDAMISGWLPDAREKVELIAKQSVFRGMSQLLGIASELEQTAMILWPSEKAHDRVDVLVVDVTSGLRRVRPGSAMKYDTIHSKIPMLTITGEPVDTLHGLLLEQFCSQPLPQLQVRHVGNHVEYMLAGDGVGVQSAVSLVHATFLPGQKEMHRGPGEPPRKSTVASGISIPCRTFVFDVLLHDDVYPGREPSLNLYRTVGIFGSKDSYRDTDRFEVSESIQSLGRGIGKFRVAESSNYQEILRFVCAQRKWSGDKLRGYRCQMRFPIYSAEVVIAFDLPSAPG